MSSSEGKKVLRIAVLYAPVAYGTHRKPMQWGDVEGHPDGLTGTDLVAICYARELAKRGHEVTMYCHDSSTVDAQASREPFAIVDFSCWKDDARLTDEEREDEDDTSNDPPYDVAIAISNPNALEDADPRTLRVVNRQVSVFGIDTKEYETFGFDKFVDLYTCPSQTAVDHVTAKMPAEMRAKFRVLPNGCYPDSFGHKMGMIDGPMPGEKSHAVVPILKVPGSVAYVSSPDRGLHRLLEAWPAIRKAVPNATLKIYYQSLDSWLAFHCDPGKRTGGAVDEECTRRALYIRNALRVLEGHGVTKVGGISHRQLTEELSRTEVLAYPCDPLAFTETFSVAVLEGCAAGCAVVTTDADCLEEVHGGAVSFVRRAREDWPATFRELVISCLKNEGHRAAVWHLGKPHARNFAWPLLAERYEAMLLEALEKKRSAPCVVVSGEAPESSGVVAVEPPRNVLVDLVLTEYGVGAEPIDVDAPFDRSGAGGCPAGFMGLARALSKRGYAVRAFSKFKNIGQGSSAYYVAKDGVEYWDWRTFGLDKPHAAGDGRPDVIVAYYDTSPLCGLTRVDGGSGPDVLRVASHHTFALPCPGAVEWTDANLAPSQYAVDALRKVYDDSAPWYVMPNAVPSDARRVTWNPVPGRCVWHASPSRGLEHLLVAWPEIRRSIPNATLHVVGDVDGWLRHYRGKLDRQAKKAARVEELISRYTKEYGVEYQSAGLGIEFLGPLSREDLLRELSEASCFPFSFDAIAPCETFSVSVMECLAIGVPVVLTPGDALGSIYCDSNYGERETPVISSSLAEIARRTVGVLQLAPSERGKWAEKCRGFASPYTYENSARALDLAIRENLAPEVVERLRRNPGSVQFGGNVVGGPRGVPLPGTFA